MTIMWADNWQFDFVYAWTPTSRAAMPKAHARMRKQKLLPAKFAASCPEFQSQELCDEAVAYLAVRTRRLQDQSRRANVGNRGDARHTPDAICLLDRANGLLFTGDTYYPAPIWLFRPETDLDAYVASVQRIAALGPDLKLVLGAHKIPVAQAVRASATGNRNPSGAAPEKARANGGADKVISVDRRISFLCGRRALRG